MESPQTELDWSDATLPGRLVMRARRLADLSQRDLAARVGSSQSAVARIERGRTRIGLASFTTMLRQAGLRLAVLDAQGQEVLPVPADAVRDNQERRFPAHLDVAPPDEVPWERWAFPRYDRPEARGWYRLRDTRDELVEGSPSATRPTDHPTRTELNTRRRLMRGPQPRVDAAPRPDVVCECPDRCFEELCVTECPCQCEPASADVRRRLAQRTSRPGSAADAGAHLVELGEEGEVERPS